MLTVSNTPEGSTAGFLAALQARVARAPRHPVVFATLMTAMAGFLDAVGYAQLGRLYVSFMSGNSTQLGIAIAQGHNILLILAIIAALRGRRRARHLCRGRQCPASPP